MAGEMAVLHLLKEHGEDLADHGLVVFGFQPGGHLGGLGLPTPLAAVLAIVLAGLAGVIVLIVAERPARLRRSTPWRLLATFAAALVALYLAPPSPQVFGNTWAPGEATRELFLAQWAMVLPIAVAATALRWGLHRVLR